jgi:hypothetical protein
MLSRNFTIPKAGLLAACLASLSAWGAQPASLIVHNAKVTPWVISLDPRSSAGKIKIFDVPPQYDEDGELLNDSVKVAQIRAGSKKSDSKTNEVLSFTMERTKKNYWIICYPKSCLVNMTINFNPSSVKLGDPKSTACFDPESVSVSPGRPFGAARGSLRPPSRSEFG